MTRNSAKNHPQPEWAISGRRQWQGTARVVGSVVRRGRFFKPGGPLFHKAKSPAPFHSIKSVDHLISIENSYQPVHRSRGVARAECNVFSKDAPGILDGRQYDVLIRGVHGTCLTKLDSIRMARRSFLRSTV